MSTLVAVKNLSSHITSEKLKQIFSEIGNVTYVTLKYKNERFRKLAFVGFETEAEAESAVSTFHDTYIFQSKVIVQLYDSNNANRTSKSTEEERQHKRNMTFKKMVDESTTAMSGRLKTMMKDSDFIRFLELNKNKRTNLVQTCKERYGLDFLEKKEEKEKEESKEETEEEKSEKLATDKNVSDLEYLQSLVKAPEKVVPGFYSDVNKLTVRIQAVERRSDLKRSDPRRLYQPLDKSAVREFVKPVDVLAIRQPKKKKVNSVVYVDVATKAEAEQLVAKSKILCGGVHVKVKLVTQDQTISLGVESQESQEMKEKEEALLAEAPSVAESGRLFVKGIYYNAVEDNLKEHFEKFGTVTDVEMPVCRITRRKMGYAFVTYMFPNEAMVAMNSLDNQPFMGRRIRVLPCLQKNKEDNPTHLKFKDQRLRDKKATASSWHNWNSLFISSTALADVMAKRFDTSKKQLYEDEGNQSAGVNMALGETQIVHEIKSFLESEGVCLESFSGETTKRSKLVILVKNLSANTTAHELRTIFDRYGQLGRLLLPASGVSGIVEFLDQNEASKAFKALAYSRFKDAPLYLEWAPEDIFYFPMSKKLPQKSLKGSQETNTSGKVDNEKGSESAKEKTAAEDSQPKTGGSTTVIIKNIDFKTTDDDLKNFFSEIGGVVKALVARRKDQPTLSMGFGFVQFESEALVEEALRRLSNARFQGRELQLSRSLKNSLDSSAPSRRKDYLPGKALTPKILVRNVPFQATMKDIRLLFQTFGELKFVRLPKKPGSEDHRGFAFVEFITMEDAKRAFEALSASTHLYQRKLVLEWAKDDDTVEEIRKRTAERFLAANSTKGSCKKLKMAVQSVSEKTEEKF